MKVQKRREIEVNAVGSLQCGNCGAAIHIDNVYLPNGARTITKCGLCHALMIDNARGEPCTVYIWKSGVPLE